MSDDLYKYVSSNDKVDLSRPYWKAYPEVNILDQDIDIDESSLVTHLHYNTSLFLRDLEEISRDGMEEHGYDFHKEAEYQAALKELIGYYEDHFNISVSKDVEGAVDREFLNAMVYKTHLGDTFVSPEFIKLESGKGSPASNSFWSKQSSDELSPTDKDGGGILASMFAGAVEILTGSYKGDVPEEPVNVKERPAMAAKQVLQDIQDLGFGNKR